MRKANKYTLLILLFFIAASCSRHIVRENPRVQTEQQVTHN